ncbi:MAG: hypothetical protein ACOC2F_05925 [Bacteroidota bacterium]
MKRINGILVLLLSSIFVFVSCSKDDEPELPAYVEPSIAGEQVIVETPAHLVTKANEGDFNASIAVMYIEWANSLSQFGSSFYLPDDTEVKNAGNGKAVYSWTYPGGYGYWMTFSDEGGKYTWTYEWEIPEQDRFTYIYAEENKDGKSGSWTIYDPSSPVQEVWVYNWIIDSNDNFSATLTWDESVDSYGVFEVESNADGSGSFTYTVDGTDQVEIIWNADGSGNYQLNYDEDVINYSWTAG